jgi:hypothetical protein
MPPPPPGGAHVPPAEELATMPGVTPAQQAEIRKILLQRRDAQEALQHKMRDEFDALHAKERSEHERVDDQASAQLRKLLGDEGYRNYAEWTLAHRAPHGGTRPGRPDHFGPDHFGPDRGGPEHSGPERSGPDRSELPPPPFPGAPGGGHAAPSDGIED